MLSLEDNVFVPVMETIDTLFKEKKNELSKQIKYFPVIYIRS